MSKVHAARQGFITKAALPSITRTRGLATYNSSLMLHGDGTSGSTTITDSSNNNFTATVVGNTNINTTTKKFGTGSIYFDGTGDYLTYAANSAFDMGAGNFTVECWIYITSLAAAREICSINTNTASDAYCQVRLLVNTNGSMYFLSASGATTWIPGSLTTTATGLITTNTWYHIAAVRNGNNFNLYIDGTSRLSFTSSATLYNNNNISVIAARNSNGSYGQYMLGYIDDFRVMKGYAVYTANFTPPTAALADNITTTQNITNSVYGAYQLF